MRLLSFMFEGEECFGAITQDGVADLSGGEWPTLRAMIEAIGIEQIGRWAATARRTLLLDDLILLPPIPKPDKIICVGVAYREHVTELDRPAPEKPTLFTRFPGSFVGHGQPVIRPYLSIRFDYEAELGVVVGKAGRHIPAAQALDHVAGYTCVAENSVRDYQVHNAQVTPGKNFDSSGAVGPWLVTTDEIPDPSALHLVGRLNGAVMQEANTSDLIFPVADIIAYISEFAELSPGDLIATGTPAGVGGLRTPPLFMAHGDRFEVEISGIGTLLNVVADELKPEHFH